MSIYKDQSAFDIVLDTSIDLSTADSVAIQYEKPDGTEGSWAGSVDSTTKVLYAVQDGDIDQVGTWRFQAVAVFGSRTGYGNDVFVDVEERVTAL